MHTHSYQRCLEHAHEVHWRIDEVLGDRAFVRTRRWLPSGLSAADRLPFLDEDERRKLSHVEPASYVHPFGCVEEFIAPQSPRSASSAKATTAPPSTRCRTSSPRK